MSAQCRDEESGRKATAQKNTALYVGYEVRKQGLRSGPDYMPVV